jgi:hypothetical protein
VNKKTVPVINLKVGRADDFSLFNCKNCKDTDLKTSEISLGRPW